MTDLVTGTIVTNTNVEGSRWADSAANPLDDIKRAIERMNASVDYSTATFCLSARALRRLMRAILTKRKFRRWRGKMKGARR